MKQFLYKAVVVATLIFGTHQTQAQCYSAVQLDGVNDYLHSSFNNYAFTNFTVEMWINSNNYLANDVYVTFNHFACVILGGWSADGSFNAFADGLNPQYLNSGSGSTPAPGTWHHIAQVYDGTNHILYIDGVAVASSTPVGSITLGNGNTYGLTIGARFDGTQQYTNTAFEDVRVWYVARTPAEINANMSTNLTGTEPGLVAYYRFEDGAGSTTVTDLSGNGNHLTMHNMDPAAAWTSGLFSTDVETTDVITSCGPLTWIDGNTYASSNSSATYTYLGGAAGGCDSIVSLDLTVLSPMDSTVTTTATGLSSNQVAGADYQWIDCDNGLALIAGATNQVFIPETGGNYAVIITGLNGCRDTSACVPIEFSSLEESSLALGLTVAPNPTNGQFSISTSNYFGEVTVKVSDILGKLIFESSEELNPNATINLDLEGAASGVYIVNISDRNEAHSIRVIKK